MRGPAGTSINLTIFRPGSEEPIETTVTRGVIELEPVTHTVADGGIGIITVNEFSRDVGADVYAAWGEIQKEVGGKVNGLILDLRSNPGGSLDEAVALSDLFLVFTERRDRTGQTPTDRLLSFKVTKALAF